MKVLFVMRLSDVLSAVNREYENGVYIKRYTYWCLEFKEVCTFKHFMNCMQL